MRARVIERLRELRRAVGRGAAGRRGSRAACACCAPSTGVRIGGGEMARTFEDLRLALGGRRARRLPARRRAGARASRARGRSPSWRCGATAGSPRTPGPTGSGCWPTCTCAPASAAARISSSPMTRPAWTPERRDFMLAEPVASRRRRLRRRTRRARTRDACSTRRRSRSTRSTGDAVRRGRGIERVGFVGLGNMGGPMCGAPGPGRLRGVARSTSMTPRWPARGRGRRAGRRRSAADCASRGRGR